uniref:Beta-defensin-like domain-containing protein n=1 Tax=Catharus ustulatus TaxID=91951 RepID=A0A8C3U3V6_CATUS
MKILFLLFPLILLLLQGAAGSPNTCRQMRGFCFRNDCPGGTTAVGICGRRLLCCKR